MVLELSNGTYLHTAYAVSNIAEEFTTDDWSLTSQEGMNYIGTYTDSSSIDSTDPTAYNWEELLDTSIDDTDSDGEMPVADYQAQLDALQDQVSILQTDKDNLETSIENNAGNVATASELSSSAQDLALEANQVAQATGQHFWSTEEVTYYLSADTTVDTSKTYYSYDGTDYTEVTPTGNENPQALGWYETLGSGAYVTAQTQEEFKATPTGKNSLWNSLGMLFRSGLNNLLAIVTGAVTGITIYDGQGNNSGNIVASFTDNGAVIGKPSMPHLEINNSGMVGINKEALPTFEVKHSGQTLIETRVIVVDQQLTSNVPLDIELPGVLTASQTIVVPISSGPVHYPEITITAGTPNSAVYQATSPSVRIELSYNGDKTLTIIDDSSAYTVNVYSVRYSITTDAPYLTAGGRAGNIGGFSSVLGEGLTASQHYQTVVGKYNKTTDNESTDNAFIVGGGTALTGRDIFTVGWEGDIQNTGSITAYNHSSPIGDIIDSYLTTDKNCTSSTSAGTMVCSVTLDPGVWILLCSVRFPATSTTGRRYANVSTTSGASTVNVNQTATGGTFTQLRFVRCFQPAETTTYYLNALQNSGSTLVLPAGAADSTNAMRAIRIA